jgi:hypothetical protein
MPTRQGATRWVALIEGLVAQASRRGWRRLKPAATKDDPKKKQGRFENRPYKAWVSAGTIFAAI